MHRTTRKVVTTSEGLEYYHHATRLISEMDNAVRQVLLMVQFALFKR